MSRSKLVIAVFIFLSLIVLLAPIPLGAAAPAEHHITLQARMFAYEPSIIRVNRGDRVVMDLAPEDVVHGLYIDGYGVQVDAEPGQTKRVEFVADRAGKFRFRCSVSCGALHPFMIGELVVGPNVPYWRGLALTLLAAVGVLAFVVTQDESRGATAGGDSRL